MYLYCGNNPITRVDTSGELWLSISLFVGISILATAALSSCAKQTKIEKNSNGILKSYSSYQDALNAGNQAVLINGQNGTAQTPISKRKVWS